MQRKITCPVDGNEESPSVFASDPWCSDNCHKDLAEWFGLSQKELTAEFFWALLDESDRVVKDKRNPWSKMRGLISVDNPLGTRRHGASSDFGRQVLQRARTRPVDWSRRCVRLSKGPWRIKVRELQRASA